MNNKEEWEMLGRSIVMLTEGQVSADNTVTTTKEKPEINISSLHTTRTTYVNKTFADELFAEGRNDNSRSRIDVNKLWTHPQAEDSNYNKEEENTTLEKLLELDSFTNNEKENSAGLRSEPAIVTKDVLGSEKREQKVANEFQAGTSINKTNIQSSAKPEQPLSLTMNKNNHFLILLTLFNICLFAGTLGVLYMRRSTMHETTVGTEILDLKEKFIYNVSSEKQMEDIVQGLEQELIKFKHISKFLDSQLKQKTEAHEDLYSQLQTLQETESKLLETISNQKSMYYYIQDKLLLREESLARAKNIILMISTFLNTLQALSSDKNVDIKKINRVIRAFAENFIKDSEILR